MPPAAVSTFRSLPPDAVLEAAADVYLDAFSRPPYAETAADRTAFMDRARRYAARDGFRLVTARLDGELVGMGLGVVAHPGDWYRGQLASQLAPAEAERWLGERCLEVVHLAVRDAAEGRGIGRLLLGALVADPETPTGVLTVDPRAERARRLYLRGGWSLVADAIRIGAHGPMELLGRDL